MFIFKKSETSEIFFGFGWNQNKNMSTPLKWSIDKENDIFTYFPTIQKRFHKKWVEISFSSHTFFILLKKVGKKT